MSDANETILSVEDGDDDFFIMQHAFQKAAVISGLQRVDDGEKAIRYLCGEGPFLDRASFPFPRLILLDLKLPVKHGFEVLKWIRNEEKFHTVVVIILTSSDNSKDVRQAYTLGANAYLVKPSTIDGMIETVRAVKDFWLKKNQFCSDRIESSFFPRI